jgi:nucleoside-diphosphate-sugar epimerase
MDDKKPMDKKPNKLFCFGYGYVAKHLAHNLQNSDEEWIIAGTTTDKARLAEMRAEGIKAYLFSDKMPFNDPVFILKDVTHILISTPAKSDGDVVFKTHARDILQIPTVEWIGYLSSTAVYGNRDGEWVDETSEIRPTSERGSKRAKAETQWLKMRRIAGIPINIFRLAGIYGAGRSALDSVQAGISKRVHKQGHAFNRIHVDDITQTLVASMQHGDKGDIYNLADDNPAPSHELLDYASQLLGIESPPLMDYSEDLDMSPMAHSFYKDNKRIQNTKIKEKLDVALKHPDYRSGLDAIYKTFNQ